MFLPPANEVCEGYVFTGVCHSVHRRGRAWLLGGRAWLLRGACMVAQGGMHGCSGGGHAWLLGGVRGCSWGGGVWLLLGGMCGCSRGQHAWLLREGMCGCSGGACVVAPGGACMVAPGGHAWLLWGGMRGCSGVCAWFFQWDAVNEWAVCILLECILVTPVCDSVHRGGESASQGACVAGGHAWQGVCGGAACMTGETATAGDRTHPIGMHSCLWI